MERKHFFDAGLIALDHPSQRRLNIIDKKIFASIVAWLEDQKIRHLKISERSHLRNFVELQKWMEQYIIYKTCLKMPKFNEEAEELSWLLGTAIRLEYLDFQENYKVIFCPTMKNLNKNHNKNIALDFKSFYRNINSEHIDFEQCVRVLCDQFSFMMLDKSKILLESAALFINRNKQYLNNSNVMKQLDFENNYLSTKHSNFALAKRILISNQVLKLRKLQTLINETLASVQNITANPKTDSKLGKIGF